MFGGCPDSSRRDADIQVGAQCERLSATKLKRNPRVYDDGVVLKESCKTVFLSQPVVIGTQGAKADYATAARDTSGRLQHQSSRN